MVFLWVKLSCFFTFFSSPPHCHLETKILASEDMDGDHKRLYVQWFEVSPLWSHGRIYRRWISFFSHFPFWKHCLLDHSFLLWEAHCWRKIPSISTDLDHHWRNPKKWRIWIGCRHWGRGRNTSLKNLFHFDISKNITKSTTNTTKNTQNKEIYYFLLCLYCIIHSRMHGLKIDLCSNKFQGKIPGSRT